MSRLPLWVTKTHSPGGLREKVWNNSLRAGAASGEEKCEVAGGEAWQATALRDVPAPTEESPAGILCCYPGNLNTPCPFFPLLKAQWEGQ